MKDEGTWMNAKKAVELGFADGILYKTEEQTEDLIATAYSPFHVVNSLAEKIRAAEPEPEPEPEPVSPEPDSDPDPEDIENKKDETLIRMRLLGIRI